MVSLFAGEAEGRLAQIFSDALERRLEPIYNFMNDLPGLQGQVIPSSPPSSRQVRSACLQRCRIGPRDRIWSLICISLPFPCRAKAGSPFPVS
jgi:hypothetical protein